MVYVSSSIWLCMEGLRGTAHSRLPSGGIARLLRYYPSIRLPVFRLPSFVSCRAYRMVTPHAGRYRLSPVIAMSLCGMADSKPRSAAQYLAFYDITRVAFRNPNNVGALIVPFVANMPYDPTTLFPTLNLQCYHCMFRVATDDVAYILSHGISTR